MKRALLVAVVVLVAALVVFWTLRDDPGGSAAPTQANTRTTGTTEATVAPTRATPHPVDEVTDASVATDRRTDAPTPGAAEPVTPEEQRALVEAHVAWLGDQRSHPCMQNPTYARMVTSFETERVAMEKVVAGTDDAAVAAAAKRTKANRAFVSRFLQGCQDPTFEDRVKAYEAKQPKAPASKP